jgi:hypothetical protein
LFTSKKSISEKEHKDNLFARWRLYSHSRFPVFSVVFPARSFYSRLQYSSRRCSYYGNDSSYFQIVLYETALE